MKLSELCERLEGQLEAETRKCKKWHEAYKACRQQWEDTYQELKRLRDKYEPIGRSQ